MRAPASRMKSSARLRLAALCAVTAAAALLSCAINVREYTLYMPEGMKECSLCHTVDDRDRPLAGGHELVDEMKEMCSGCHAERVEEGEHPVGVVQKRETPLPLFDGMVECPSCHEPHGRGGNIAMLRLPREKLCSACHDF